MKYIILLADNNERFLDAKAKLLSEEGYIVRTASNPQETRAALLDGKMDLAIIDRRLEDDDSPDDDSGVRIAMSDSFRRIPKIILTAAETSYEEQREVLGGRPDALPFALAFVGKKEGPEALLKVIRDILESWPRIRSSTLKVSDRIQADHSAARAQSRLNYGVAFTVSIFGFLVIFAGILLAWLDKLAIGIVGTTSGIIIEALGYLFFKRLDLSNNRMDLYHREILETYWLELLLAACEQLPAERRVVCAERAISAAIDHWLLPQPRAEAPQSIDS